MNPRPVKSLAEVAPNQRVSFAYYGGENEGATRTVDVTEVSDDRIYGVDVDKQEPRQYLFDKAAIVLVLREANEPEPAEAATEVEPPVADVVNEPPATTRVRRTCLSFIEARQRLHDQIDTLNGEDLAEVLAEVLAAVEDLDGVEDLAKEDGGNLYNTILRAVLKYHQDCSYTLSKVI